MNERQKEIEKIFSRGIVSEILPSKGELMKKLSEVKKLRIYIGADPTSDSLHLSHAKNYMFLEELRQLGHEVIVLFGDFTAQIGDPTDRESSRTQLTKAQVERNVKGWLKQIQPLLDFKSWKNPAKIMYNSKWLSKLSFKDVVSLASNFTVQQMIERDMFEKRLKEEKPIHLHEFLYPLMQGYDSVAMDVDIELCGTDQIFNALAGRTLQKRINSKDKFVVALNLMANPKTGELMSKSRGTGVFLSSDSNEMFGAIMAQPDEMTEVMFVNNTRIPLEEKEQIMSLGPRDAKARIACEIVKIFYGEKKAKAAQDNFVSVFSKKEAPIDAPVFSLSNELLLSDVFLAAGVVSSKTQFTTLVRQGAITNLDTGEKVMEFRAEPKRGTYKIGSHTFLKLR